jgi:hypothetical protein
MITRRSLTVMSENAGSVLVAYQGRLLAAVGGVGRVVAVQRVPDDGDRIAVQAGRDGAAHGVLGAAAGLADAG